MNYGREELLSLPLFLGMGKSEMDVIQDDASIALSSVRRGAAIVKRGEPCGCIVIVTKGMFDCRSFSDDGAYSIDELLHAPMTIQPERIYGMTQRYTSDFIAQTSCEVMRIEKKMVERLMNVSMTFRINFMNAVTTANQRLVSQYWHQQSDVIEQRIIRFVKDRCVYPAGHKVVNIQMKTLARELGCSRLEVSQALHLLEHQELIKVHRGSFEIPMLQLLSGK